jgi:galactose mutarotase-like enzyme
MSEQEFPADENGDVLRRMHEAGDDLTQSRVIDFCFIFNGRERALAFAAVVDDKNEEVCISYSQERDCWQVIVKHQLIPAHDTITELESVLTSKALAVGGKADGWGCLQIPRR